MSAWLVIVAVFAVLFLGFLLGALQEGWYARNRGDGSRQERRDPLHSGQWSLAENKMKAGRSFTFDWGTWTEQDQALKEDQEWLERHRRLTEYRDITSIEEWK